jgi:hypothetical protein
MGGFKQEPSTLTGSLRRTSFAASDVTESEGTASDNGASMEAMDIPPGIAVDYYPRSQFWPGSAGNIVVPVRKWKNGGNIGGDNRTFSVMSYNILCPMYATPTMFRATEARHLDWEVRKWKLLEDIAVYGADIICLQVS